MSDLSEYFLRHYTLVLDNDQASYRDVREIVVNFLIGEEVTMEDYRTMSDAERADRFAQGIGELVLEHITDVIEEVADSCSSSLGSSLIKEIMAGGWPELEYALGKHYMPEPADMEGVLDEGEDECKGHESLSGALGEAVYCDGSCQL